MRRWIRKIQIAAFLMCLSPSAQAAVLNCPPGCQPPDENEVRVLVPLFASQNPGLGGTVGTVLAFQIWQTLRHGPEENIGTTHGSVAIDSSDFWKSAPANLSADYLLRRAAAEPSGNRAQMVFWGAAQPFAGGIIVQSSLMIGQDRRRRQPQFWTIKYSQDGTLKAELPSLTYEFRPFVLNAEVIARYSNAQGIPVFSDSAGQHAIGFVGQQMRALQQLPTAALIVTGTSRVLQGWIMLPALAESRSEAVDFVSGLVRIYRADWGGAIDMMGKVVANRNAPTKLQADANLYIAMAAAQKQGMDIDTMQGALGAAEELMPESRSVTMYKIMADLAMALKAPPAQRAELLGAADTLLTERAWIFGDSDNWLRNARQAIQTLRGAR